MMVLSRKIGEVIVIDEGRFRITVLEILDGHKVRLGIEAPREISVDREEVHREKMLRRAREEGSSSQGSTGA